MDPDAALAQARAAAGRINETDAGDGASVDRQDVTDLLDAFMALDGWLAKGGFLPNGWDDTGSMVEDFDRTLMPAPRLRQHLNEEHDIVTEDLDDNERMGARMSLTPEQEAAALALAELHPSVWFDEASAFTCTEAEIVAAFLAAFRDEDVAAKFIVAHGLGDDEGDMHPQPDGTEVTY
jgi:hypothetical protein